MSRSQRVYLQDILDACDKIHRYTQGMTFAAFVADERTIDAVIRNIQIIGEAVKNIATETRATYPETDWKKIAGLRDIIVHQYFGIDAELIWTVVSTNLAGLERTVRRMLETEP